MSVLLRCHTISETTHNTRHTTTLLNYILFHHLISPYHTTTICQPTTPSPHLTTPLHYHNLPHCYTTTVHNYIPLYFTTTTLPLCLSTTISHTITLQPLNLQYTTPPLQPPNTQNIAKVPYTTLTITIT